MARLAERASMNVRRTQQRRVAALLDEIAARRQRLYVLKAYGVRRAGLRPLKAELTAVRDELAEVVDANDDPAGAAKRRQQTRAESPRRPSPSRVPAARTG